MADLEITFGAKLEELLTGVETAKTALEGLAESLGIGLSIAGIAEFVTAMEELGETTTRTSAILGVTTTQAQQLGLAAQITGGSAEGMVNALSRMQMRLATASNESSHAGQAFKVLGINAQEFAKLPVDQQVNKFSAAVAGFADSGTKTAAVLQAMGRGAVQMIPLFDELGGNFEEFNNKLRDAGAVVAPATIEKLTELRQNFVLLKAAFTGLGEDLVASLVPASTALIQLVSDIHTVVVAGFPLERLTEDIKTAFTQLGLEALRLGAILKDVFTLNWADISTHWKNGEKLIEDDLARHAKAIEDIMAPAKKAIAETLAGGEKSGKPLVPAMDLGKGAGGQEAIAAANEQIKAIELAYKTAVDAAQARVKLGESTESELTAITLAEIDKRTNAELAALNKEESSGNLSVKQREQVEARKTQIVAQANLDRQKAVEKAAETEKAAFDKAGSAIASAFNSQLRSMLDGSETFSQGMEKVFGDLVIKLIEMIVELIAKMAVLLAFEAATGTLPANAVGSAFTSSLGKVLGLAKGSWSVGDSAPFPSYADGALTIGNGQLAMLHAGEMVVPSAPAQAIRDSIAAGPGGQGGGNNTSIAFSLSAWDGASVNQWLRSGGATIIAKAVAQAMNSNPTLRPSY